MYLPRAQVEHTARTVSEAERVLALVVADFERRRSTRRGRFLLWLLRKVT